jgi:hypothetical protein
MPVVSVLAPPLAEQELESALREFATAIAAALELQPTDVYVTAVATAAGVVGTERVDALPIVLLYGGRRSRSALEAACQVAAEVAARRWYCPADRVWVQWLLTDE